MTPAERVFTPDMAERLRRAAVRLSSYPFRPWFYGDSIGFEGLVAASELFEDDRYRQFTLRFLMDWARHDEPHGPDDNTAPGMVLCELAAQSGDTTLGAAALRLAGYLAGRRRINGTSVTFEDAARSLRQPYGEAMLDERDLALLADPGAGIYVDCLHFDPPFFMRLAALRSDEAWVARAASEASGYVSLLQDPSSGLFDHFWLERRGRSYGRGWGRGQGWALLGLLDVLALLTPTAPGRSELEAATVRLIDAMLLSQRSDGSWPAVVGVVDSGDETSTAAFMVAGFLRAERQGLGTSGQLRDAAARAWAATAAAVDGTGLLTGVSAAVYSSTNAEHYHAVPRGFDVPWGQGPLLVAAREIARADLVVA